MSDPGVPRPTPRLITERDFSSSRYGEIEISGRLSDLIVDAEAVIEAKLNNRRLSVTDYVERSRPTGQTIFLKNRPVTTIRSIQARTSVDHPWTVIPVDHCAIDYQAGTITYPRLVRGSQVEVDYAAGLDPIPGAIKEAVILQTMLLAFNDIEAYGGGDGKPPGLGYVEKQIDDMICAFRQSSLAYPHS